MRYYFGDWGHTVGRADTGTGVCRGADLHNSGIIQVQQELLRFKGVKLTPQGNNRKSPSVTATTNKLNLTVTVNILKNTLPED